MFDGFLLFDKNWGQYVEEISDCRVPGESEDDFAIFVEGLHGFGFNGACEGFAEVENWD